MAGARLSRRKIAAYIAGEILDGHDFTGRLAAYLVESKRVREAELVIRDIESALAERGVLLADVAGSRDLTAETKEAVATYLKRETGASDVHIRQQTDPHLLGGVRIDIPGRRLDSTIRHRLNQLTASKI